MDKGQIIQGKKYIEINGGIVTKDKDGTIWVAGKYKKSNLNHYVDQRQKQILDSLKQV